jgi:hypothetical protein
MICFGSTFFIFSELVLEYLEYNDF